MIALFPDQERFIADLRRVMASHRSVLGVASTGFGKTVTSAWIAQSALQKNKRVWFTVHRRLLLRQTSLEFSRLGIQHGVVRAGEPTPDHGALVCSIETLRRRLHSMAAPDLLIVDEAHLSLAPSQAEVVHWCLERGSRVLGNSGSPMRLDGKPLGDLFDAMVEAPPMRWLIDNGRLSDYRIRAPGHRIDKSQFHMFHGDYAVKDVERAMSEPHIVGDAIAHYKKFAMGKRAIAYCVSVDYSIALAEKFAEAGIAAAHIDSTTREDDREAIIEAFADGNILVLSNVEIATTGFDLSAQIGRECPAECCINLRPTRSLALALQMWGRVLRRKPEPAIILDHADLSFEHGLPDDPRQWTLAGRERKSREKQALSVRQCPLCFAVHRLADACPFCGHRYEVTGRELATYGGDLVEIDKARAKIERKRERARAQTLEDLIALGRQRGYKPGWAYHIFAARGGRR